MFTERARTTKIDLTPRRHHGYAVILFILGTLFPPLAVAARFGIGTDFWINIFLTICGYIPGHAHNFYIQNIRNNKTHRRTPKWVQRYGLVDTSEIKRKERKSQWANRYNDRLPQSALNGQEYEEGQIASGSSEDMSRRQGEQPNGGEGEYWNPREERFYGQKNDDSSSVVTGGSSGGRWHYPTNFEDTVPVAPERKKSKKDKKKKDRWARTEDAYAAQESSTRRKKSRRRKTKPTDEDTVSRVSDDTNEFPEDPEGGLYGDRRPPQSREEDAPRKTNDEDIFNHEL